MRWKVKAKIHGVLDRMPLGGQIYYLLQTKVTRTLPRKADEKYFDTLKWHVANIREYVGDPSQATLFEFGVGWDLFYNVGYYCAGIDRQILVDLNRHARPELIRHELQRFRHIEGDPFMRRPPGHFGSLGDLARMGIDYRAPADARSTGLDGGSVDVVVSTNTMEHVPLTDLASIMAEVHRILRPGGVVSAWIDYSDHYSHSDRSIGPWNYMKYSDRDWRRFNPPGHFQNRARHGQYLGLFREAGFEVIGHERLLDPLHRRPPAREELDPSFRDFDDEDLEAIAGRFVLRRP